MSIKLYLVNIITSVLPPTRLFKFKAYSYQIAGLNIKSSARIVSSAKFWGRGSISVGEYTFIGHNVLILTGEASINIGNNVDIGPNVLLVNGSHHVDMLGVRSAGAGCSKPIIIDDGVWIGASSTILGGVHIGKKSIVAAGSVVVKDIPDYVIAAGVPCRPIKYWNDEIKQWVRL